MSFEVTLPVGSEWDVKEYLKELLLADFEKSWPQIWALLQTSSEGDEINVNFNFKIKLVRKYEE